MTHCTRATPTVNWATWPRTTLMTLLGSASATPSQVASPLQASYPRAAPSLTSVSSTCTGWCTGKTKKVEEGLLRKGWQLRKNPLCFDWTKGIFEFPVTDLIAPGYSTIIKNPMDLSSMKSKIDSSEYSNVMEYRDDLILMCDNCMTYNKVLVFGFLNSEPYWIWIFSFFVEVS